MSGRKLPAIYARTRFCVPFDGRGLGLVPAYTREPKPDEAAEFTRYEPAKPTCATCSSFTLIPPSNKAVCGLTIRQQPWFVPVNGSGYCHEHPEARRDA